MRTKRRRSYRCWLPGLILLCLVTAVGARPVGGQAATSRELVVTPGDTWAALAARTAMPVAVLQNVHNVVNRDREPAIGSIVRLPAGSLERAGRLRRTADASLLATAVAAGVNPWRLAALNGRLHPYRPNLGRSIYSPGGDQPPRDLPPGLATLEVNDATPAPGQALAWRGRLAGDTPPAATLESAGRALRRFDVFANGRHVVALTGVGAFHPPGAHELTIVDANGAWRQPWLMRAGVWTFDDITLTGEAAAIDQASIAAERARLFDVWDTRTPAIHWSDAFQLPIRDFLAFSSAYGARRSYNGGPYSTYHEGVDFSAYGGTAVIAPAAGVVVVAERLYVRGNAVIIDHGLGLFSGVYHLSELHVQPGQAVAAGDLLGEVGSTGLSTGNHLHWDLLVGGVWVDALHWTETDLACWVAAGWGEPCP